MRKALGSRGEAASARGGLVVGLVASLALHLVAYGAIPFGRDPAPRAPRSDEVAVQVIEPEPESEPDPPPEPETTPEPVSPRPTPAPEPPTREARQPDAPEPPPDSPPPPAEETPVRFDNLTLTNEGSDSSWAMDPGSGEASDEPLAPPGAPTGRRREGVAGGVPGGTGEPQPGPRVVAASDLSRMPRPPSRSKLDALLRKHYPSEARNQGVEGQATVKLRIDPDGSVGRTRLVSQRPEGYGFGPACRRMLESTRWEGGRDDQGRSVASWHTFECGFELK